MNVVLLRGTLHGEPNDVTLATGELVRTWELAAETASSAVGPSAATVQKVPIRWVDPTKAVRSFDDGDEVVVTGSVRRRFFRAGGATASKTEVLGHKVAKASRRRAVEQLIEGFRQTIEQGLGLVG